MSDYDDSYSPWPGDSICHYTGKMSEHDIQSQIRIAISQNKSRSFRINVGVAWTGNKIKTNSDGSKTIYDPRPFATFGSVDETKKLKGFSDLFVITPTVITPDMVGKKIAIIGFVEVKDDTGKPSDEQLDFIEQMQNLGARAGVARSVDDAVNILWGG